jgi:hypothetical protein
MRLMASLTVLGLVLSLAACDSTTSSNSSSPLVGTWKMTDSIKYDTTVQTPLGVDSTIVSIGLITATYNFATNGILSLTTTAHVAVNGTVVMNVDTSYTGSWKATATQLYETVSDSTVVMSYSISGDTLKRTEPNSSSTGTDTTFTFIRQ